MQQFWEKIKPTSIAQFFLIIAACFGFIFVFLSPPMQAPDEQLHYWRIYQLSDLDLFANSYSDARKGYDIPKDMKDMSELFLSGTQPKALLDWKKLQSTYKLNDYTNKVPAFFENTAIYSPAGYAPQILMMKLATKAEAPHIATFYSLRIIGLIFYISLVYAAITLAPRGKKLFAALGLLPMSLYMASSISIDGALIGLSMLAVSATMNLYDSKKNDLSHKKIFLLLLLSLFLISATKMGYFLFGLLLFIIPKKYFWNKTFARVFQIILVACVIGAGILWNALIVNDANSIHAVLRPGEFIDSKEQTTFMLSHPIHTISAVLNTIFLKSATLIYMSFVGVFGWLDIAMPFYAYALFAALLYYLLIEHGFTPRKIILRSKEIIFPIAFCAIFLLTLLSLYAGYSVVGSTYIEGIQGRYFIPMLTLLIPLVSRQKSPNSSKISLFYSLTILLLLFMAQFAILNANILRINYL